ncbi:MAG: DUF397 domain-containing protein [Actinophytocola sp.]
MTFWRKSRRSENDQNCAEVRNSKNTSSVVRADVRRLAQAVKEGRL